jgi:hypothetical protein
MVTGCLRLRALDHPPKLLRTFMRLMPVAYAERWIWLKV